MKNLNEKRPSGLALLPFAMFIVIYMGAGIYYQVKGMEMAFYQFPSVTAMFLAVVAAFCMGKEKLDEKFSIFARGAANENVLTMLMIYILAGAFSTVAKSMGGVDATVNLGLAIIPVELLVAGMFVISAFLGTATGTSVGTITALVPIAVGLASESGLSVPLMLGACAGGAMFGDNLSMISDTTIAVTRTQCVALKDKFRVNFFIALPAALITLAVLLLIGRGDAAVISAAIRDPGGRILQLVNNESTPFLPTAEWVRHEFRFVPKHDGAGNLVLRSSLGTDRAKDLRFRNISVQGAEGTLPAPDKVMDQAWIALQFRKDVPVTISCELKKDGVQK